MLAVMCVGYEMGRWRQSEFVQDTLRAHLTSFSLRYSEYSAIDGDTAAEALKKAAQAVYSTEKYKSRGEFGELILHGVLRDFYAAAPAVSKIYYKDAENDVVKGFDSVHVVETNDGLELWLGEAKLYASAVGAVYAAIGSLHAHVDAGFLRREFVAITNKLDESWEHSAALKALLSENQSLDSIVDVIVMPVLVTYNSDAVKNAASVTEKYRTELVAEAQTIWQDFSDKLHLDVELRIELILVALQSKDRLVTEFHERLQQWQAI